MTREDNVIHTELQKVYKSFPRLWLNRFSTPVFRFAAKIVQGPKSSTAVDIKETRIPASDAHRQIGLRIYKPKQLQNPAPALVWMHGGGYLIGHPAQNDGYIFELLRELPMTVISVDYCLAPDHPFPQPLDDCYAALLWAFKNADPIGIDPARIAVGGESAGGGLAATLTQIACARGEVEPVFQLLVYPMLDDRTTLRSDLTHTDLFTWTVENNRFGWESYLHSPCGSTIVPEFSVAARRSDLAGLPPAWIGVGTLDLFHDEDVEYARCLAENGIRVDLKEIPGAFHGFDIFSPELPVVKSFRSSQVNALRKALFL